MGRPNVVLCLIATNRYVEFLEPLAASCLHLFLPGCNLRFAVFTNRDVLLRDVALIRVPHRPWPYATLYRYHMMRSVLSELRKADFVFYMDVDSLVISEIGEEVLGQRVACRHEGYIWADPANFPYETRPESAAYIKPGDGYEYFAGGFQGGRSETFCRDIEELAAMVDADQKRGIVARWHDESHWNRYLIDHAPDRIMPGNFMTCETKMANGAKLVALLKNHQEIRK